MINSTPPTDEKPVKLVKLEYVGPMTKSFGVNLGDTKTRLNPAKSKLLELPDTDAATLLSVEPDNWKYATETTAPLAALPEFKQEAEKVKRRDPPPD